MLFLNIIKKGGKTKRKQKTKGKKQKTLSKKQKTLSKKPKTLSKKPKTLSKKQKIPTSLSVFPDKSPQLQKDNQPTKLNKFTTKNVAVKDKNNNEYNIILNNRLAYKRPARGQDVHADTSVIYGPIVEPLKSNNYKSLKKGDIVYYDRSSVVLRGPFFFEAHRRGPELLFRIKDIVYPNEYLFNIAVSDLEKENLYVIKNKTKGKVKTAKRKIKKHKGGNKHNFSIIGGFIHKSKNNNWTTALDSSFHL